MGNLGINSQNRQLVVLFSVFSFIKKKKNQKEGLLLLVRLDENYISKQQIGNSEV